VLGSDSEQAAFLTMVELSNIVRHENTLINADASYHTERNLKQLRALEVPAILVRLSRCLPTSGTPSD
jgi:hypothetical protein